MINLIDNLITIRNDNNLSQLDFGKMVGRGRSAVCHWETGRNDIPLYVLIKLSNLTGYTLDELVNKKL